MQPENERLLDEEGLVDMEGVLRNKYLMKLMQVMIMLKFMESYHHQQMMLTMHGKKML